MVAPVEVGLAEMDEMFGGLVVVNVWSEDVDVLPKESAETTAK